MDPNTIKVLITMIHSHPVDRSKSLVENLSNVLNFAVAQLDQNGAYVKFGFTTPEEALVAKKLAKVVDTAIAEVTIKRLQDGIVDQKKKLENLKKN